MTQRYIAPETLIYVSSKTDTDNVCFIQSNASQAQAEEGGTSAQKTLRPFGPSSSCLFKPATSFGLLHGTTMESGPFVVTEPNVLTTKQEAEIPIISSNFSMLGRQHFQGRNLLHGREHLPEALMTATKVQESPLFLLAQRSGTQQGLGLLSSGPHGEVNSSTATPILNVASSDAERRDFVILNSSTRHRNGYSKLSFDRSTEAAAATEPAASPSCDLTLMASEVTLSPSALSLTFALLTCLTPDFDLYDLDSSDPHHPDTALLDLFALVTCLLNFEDYSGGSGGQNACSPQRPLSVLDNDLSLSLTAKSDSGGEGCNTLATERSISFSKSSHHSPLPGAAARGRKDDLSDGPLVLSLPSTRRGDQPSPHTSCSAKVSFTGITKGGQLSPSLSAAVSGLEEDLGEDDEDGSGGETAHSQPPILSVLALIFSYVETQESLASGAMKKGLTAKAEVDSNSRASALKLN